jgi:hypothetical protein
VGKTEILPQASFVQTFFAVKQDSTADGYLPPAPLCRYALFRFSQKSDCSLDLTGTQAGSASVDVLHLTVDDSLDASDVGLPSAVGASVRVRDLDAESDILTAVITFCHIFHLQACVVRSARTIISKKIADCNPRTGKFKNLSDTAAVSGLEKGEKMCYYI